ncbi:ribbon-helix-helix protein, CopG family [Loktanella atrilutea]|uniref:ribbon-helix-helix protein, CopG family n=1 Tax=Loktanella atrilutea TaxID=366533 RepID=UPI00093236B4|nr:ribbon-helix-helix protein, CopG family [Loktanella atrilutea]
MKVSVDIPEPMLRALSALARTEDVTVGQLMRDAIARDLRLRAKPKKDARTDEALVASLRSLLAQDLADAQDWPDLQGRLARHGFALRPAGGGLILCSLSDGQKCCKASDLGYAHSHLARTFGRAFPGHPQAHLYRPTKPPAAVVLIEDS